MITSLIIGIVSGWVASVIMHVKSKGWVTNLIIGIIGSMLGHYFISLLGLFAYSFFSNIIVSIAGACVSLYIGKKLF